MMLSDRVPTGLRAEAGFAVPAVMLAMLAVFALGTAAVMSSVGAQSGTVRDSATKQALAVAEAGVANALARFNSIRTTGDADACAPVGGGSVGAGGWCPTSVPGDVDRGSYEYWTRITPASGSTPAQLTIVSQGTVDGVSRRVMASADTIADGYKPFQSLGAVIGLDGILLNARSEIHADVATNGNIALNSGSVLDCEYAQVGVGKGFNPNNGGTVTCPPTEGAVSLPPVNLGDVATNNQNYRICNLDPCTKSNWNPSTRRLSFNSGGSITLGAPGGTFNYAFCKLTLNANSYVLVAAEAAVRIFFLPPESCSGESQPLVLNSGSKIQPTGSGATNLAILIAGSDSRATSAVLNANSVLFDCSQSFVLYAPRTDVTLNSKTEICGGVASQSLIVNADAKISASNDAEDFELPGVEMPSHYGEPHDFVECSSELPPSSPDPTAGC